MVQGKEVKEFVAITENSKLKTYADLSSADSNLNGIGGTGDDFTLNYAQKALSLTCADHETTIILRTSGEWKVSVETPRGEVTHYGSANTIEIKNSKKYTGNASGSKFILRQGDVSLSSAMTEAYLCGEGTTKITFLTGAVIDKLYVGSSPVDDSSAKRIVIDPTAVKINVSAVGEAQIKEAEASKDATFTATKSASFDNLSVASNTNTVLNGSFKQLSVPENAENVNVGLASNSTLKSANVEGSVNFAGTGTIEKADISGSTTSDGPTLKEATISKTGAELGVVTGKVEVLSADTEKVTSFTLEGADKVKGSDSVTKTLAKDSEGNAVDLHIHSFSKSVEKSKVATYEEDGCNTYACECGIEKVEIIPMKICQNHEMKVVEAEGKAPTATKPGVTVKRCDECQKTERIAIAPLTDDRLYGSWVALQKNGYYLGWGNGDRVYADVEHLITMNGKKMTMISRIVPESVYSATVNLSNEKALEQFKQYLGESYPYLKTENGTPVIAYNYTAQSGALNLTIEGTTVAMPYHFNNDGSVSVVYPFTCDEIKFTRQYKDDFEKHIHLESQINKLAATEVSEGFVEYQCHWKEPEGTRRETIPVRIPLDKADIAWENTYTLSKGIDNKYSITCHQYLIFKDGKLTVVSYEDNDSIVSLDPAISSEEIKKSVRSSDNLWRGTSSNNFSTISYSVQSDNSGDYILFEREYIYVPVPTKNKSVRRLDFDDKGNMVLSYDSRLANSLQALYQEPYYTSDFTREVVFTQISINDENSHKHLGDYPNIHSCKVRDLNCLICGKSFAEILPVIDKSKIEGTWVGSYGDIYPGTSFRSYVYYIFDKGVVKKLSAIDEDSYDPSYSCSLSYKEQLEKMKKENPDYPMLENRFEKGTYQIEGDDIIVDPARILGGGGSNKQAFGIEFITEDYLTLRSSSVSNTTLQRVDLTNHLHWLEYDLARTVSPTNTSKGKLYGTCIICGAKQSLDLPALNDGAICIKADRKFQLLMSNTNSTVNPSLEYSYDGKNWKVFENSMWSISSSRGILYLRGTGNKAIKEYSMMTTGWDIRSLDNTSINISIE